MPRAKKGYSEIDHIREDLNSLRTNVIELTKHLKKDGDATLEEMKDSAAHKIKDLSKSSRKQIEALEGHVREKPAQSMAIAFAAGLVLSALMRR